MYDLASSLLPFVWNIIHPFNANDSAWLECFFKLASTNLSAFLYCLESYNDNASLKLLSSLEAKIGLAFFVTMFPIVEVLLGMVEIVKENTSTQQRELVEQIFFVLSFRFLSPILCEILISLILVGLHDFIGLQKYTHTTDR